MLKQSENEEIPFTSDLLLQVKQSTGAKRLRSRVAKCLQEEQKDLAAGQTISVYLDGKEEFFAGPVVQELRDKGYTVKYESMGQIGSDPAYTRLLISIDTD